MLSMSLSLLRDFILSVPLALILPRYLGVTGALYSGPIADVVSFAAAVFCVRRVFRELKRRKRVTEEPPSPRIGFAAFLRGFPGKIDLTFWKSAFKMVKKEHARQSGSPACGLKGSSNKRDSGGECCDSLYQR